MIKTRNFYNYLIIFILILINVHLVYINKQLYYDYLTSRGKKYALFGLQYMSYFYVVYLLILEFVLLFFLTISNGRKSITYISIVLVVISLLLVFLEPWKFFIKN